MEKREEREEIWRETGRGGKKYGREKEVASTSNKFIVHRCFRSSRFLLLVHIDLVVAPRCPLFCSLLLPLLTFWCLGGPRTPCLLTLPFVARPLRFIHPYTVKLTKMIITCSPFPPPLLLCPPLKKKEERGIYHCHLRPHSDPA